MTSIPQLRKDLNDTQLKLFDAEAKIKRLRELSRSSDELKKALAEIKSLKAELEYSRSEIKRLKDELKKSLAELGYARAEGKRLRDELKKSLAETKKLKAELDKALADANIRKVVVEVPVIEYRDNPKHIEMIRKLRGKT